MGGEILRNALQKPLKTIVENCGVGFETVEKKIGGKNGYNSKTGEIEDMLESGIVDAVGVILNAVKNAVSVAATILTCGTVVTLPKDEDASLQKLMKHGIM